MSEEVFFPISSRKRRATETDDVDSKSSKLARTSQSDSDSNDNDDDVRTFVPSLRSSSRDLGPTISSSSSSSSQLYLPFVPSLSSSSSSSSSSLLPPSFFAEGRREGKTEIKQERDSKREREDESFRYSSFMPEMPGSTALQKLTQSLLVRRKRAADEFFDSLANKWTNQRLMEVALSLGEHTEKELKDLMKAKRLRPYLLSFFRAHSESLYRALESLGLFQLETDLEKKVLERFNRIESVAPTTVPSLTALAQSIDEGEEASVKQFAFDRDPERESDAELAFIQSFLSPGDELKLNYSFGNSVFHPTLPMLYAYAILFRLSSFQPAPQFDLTKLLPEWPDQLRNVVSSELLKYGDTDFKSNSSIIWEDKYSKIGTLLASSYEKDSKLPPVIMKAAQKALNKEILNVLGFPSQGSMSVIFRQFRQAETTSSYNSRPLMDVIVPLREAPWLPNPKDRTLTFRWEPKSNNFVFLAPAAFRHEDSGHPFYLTFGRIYSAGVDPITNNNLELSLSDQLQQKLYDLFVPGTSISVIKSTLQMIEPEKLNQLDYFKYFIINQEKLTAIVQNVKEVKTDPVHPHYFFDKDVAETKPGLYMLVRGDLFGREMKTSVPNVTVQIIDTNTNIEPAYETIVPSLQSLTFTPAKFWHRSQKFLPLPQMLVLSKDNLPPFTPTGARRYQVVAYELQLIPYWDTQLQQVKESLGELFPDAILTLLGQYLI